MNDRLLKGFFLCTGTRNLLAMVDSRASMNVDLWVHM